MALVPGCKATVLALLMEALTIIMKFVADFAYAAQPKITPLTIAAFLKYAEDPYVLENPCRAKQDIALDVLNTIVRNSEAPLPNALIETAFPAVVNCVMHTDDHTVMVAGGECLRSFINVSPEQIFSYKNGEGVNYVMQVATVLLNPMNTEMTAGGQIVRLGITIITKMGNMLGQTVDMLLKAVISKMQNLECLKVIMNLVLIFAHLFLTQMDAVLNFLSTVPGPNGEPALQFVLTNWLSRQNSFFGAYERKLTTMALCKLFEYGVATQDNRLTSITYKEMVQEPSGNRVCTRSVASNYQKFCLG
ncbi:importin-9-like [Drosophila nasuta]|uniref:importin-9-like n=1 Tax=Drosophila nasuta TaxID=42062 RepID=UPI00295F0320|nr:importin-9-like [Drosophila nasuta]